MQKQILFVCVVLLALLVGCNTTEYKYKLPANTEAKELTPQIAGYTKFDATLAVTAIGGAISKTGQASPEPATQTAARLAKFATCMQMKGASTEIGYYNIRLSEKKELDASFAGVAIGDKKQMTDLGNLAACAGAAAQPFSIGDKSYKPCQEQFTIKSDSNEFFVLILGYHDDISGNSCKTVKDAILANAKTLEG